MLHKTMLKLIAAAVLLISITETGLAEQKIKLCPDTPNCVSSLPDEDDSHKVKTFPVIVDASTSRKVLINIINHMPRTRLITEESDYLHFTFTSLIFRFVDDVEFEITENKIHVRSASRVGHSDLGVNRKRVEEIRRLYMEKMADFNVT